jgi:hypothetical protein
MSHGRLRDDSNEAGMTPRQKPRQAQRARQIAAFIRRIKSLTSLAYLLHDVAAARELEDTLREFKQRREGEQ